MAKLVKYPRKLRQKLEKVAAGAEGRRLEQEEEYLSDPIRTFWHDFIPPKRMAFMHSKADEVLHRLTTVYYFEQPPELFPDSGERITVPAPWETETAASS